MYDLLVIGGGINGAGIARDAAGRGLKVLLCEKDDLAQHTSSASTKLIHGGLRYLAQYDFSLVRKALKEREILWEMAPHIIWPIRFVLPHHKEMRPAWLIRLGLFIYDNIGGRKRLPATESVRRGQSSMFDALKAYFKKGFEYSDCWVDDSRLVVLNTVDACERGAKVMTRTRCDELVNKGTHWSAELSQEGAGQVVIEARAVVNAAGAWVDSVVDTADVRNQAAHVRLVKGSHIITAPLFEAEKAYFFQGRDDRIIFAIPILENRFTLIGTTDIPFEGDPQNVAASSQEIQYLCDCANEYFEKSISPADVISTYSGVRPLYDDRSRNASEVTRDYVLTLDGIDDEAPILSVFGGKITTYRKLAEDALRVLSDRMGWDAAEWTQGAHLPGGNYPSEDFAAVEAELHQHFAWIGAETVERLIRAYGTRLPAVIGNAKSIADLGHHYGCGLYEAEVDYLIENEFARSVDDIVWRRSKLGLLMSEPELEVLGDRLRGRLVA